ncbi:multiple sugar transport system substrate-binding protein [Arthrobacter sp. V4I6]|uniref:ABC transporter substrate-binding protein n=1 Tax=unclassified Arthrobacter TaxID=235627 RepID=UPI0027801501|nr:MULTISPECIES: sugar ABC transporter substrate-binding protein [unclassified Arthrobacter]MDQ0819349.1 multiple sugar transport system substrate-binding protein [Arthrobacter sp. V1I7]MDQ0853533.1 multiple sugar transport system substrate-binding protein [Arthrobacter sp. V4I6]
MKFPKIASVVGMTVAAAIGLTACGSGGGAAAGPAESDGGNIRVLLSPHQWTTVIQKDLADFEADNKVKVEVTILNEDQVSNQVKVEFGSGSSDTDVIMYRPLQDHRQFVTNGWLMDLTDKVKADKVFDWEDFQPATRAAVTDEEGVINAVPVATARQMLFYRKDLFKAAGLSVPTTYDELMNAAKVLTKDETYGICSRGQRAQAVTALASYMYGHDADWTKDGEVYGAAAIDSKEAVEAYKYYGDLLRNYGPPGVLNMSWAECSALFQQGKAAMYTEGDDRWPEFIDPAKTKLTAAEVGFAPTPGGHPSNVPAQALAISAKSKHSGTAWKFIQWATGKEMTTKAQGEGVMGARASGWKSAETAKKFPQEVIDAVEFGAKNGVPYDRPRLIKVGEARDVVGGPMVVAIQGGDVEAAAKTAAKEFQAMIDVEKSEAQTK